MSRHVKDVLKQRGIALRENVPTASLCTFKIGGCASLLIEPSCKNELVEAIRILKETGHPYALLGKGSNVVFGDGFLPIALVRTSAIDAVRFFENSVFADCGISLISLAYLVARRGFADLDFCCGIPGTLGGALYMNAGAYGKCMARFVRCARVYFPETGEIRTMFCDELDFSYRNSRFQHENAVVLDATLSLGEVEEPSVILAHMRAMNEKRKATQPLEFPSGGSVFRRVAPDVPVSAMLDALSCKGMRVGGAAVSEKHAGFIVNIGGASCADVKELICCLQNKLEKERGIRPQTELRFIP